MRFCKCSWLRIMLLLMVLLFGRTGFSAEPFGDQQRVVFLGDSITHYGTWWPYVWSYYVTRCPERRLTFLNAGISGDRAVGALDRIQSDVLERDPDRVCVLFGMNDLGRSSYCENPSALDLQKQQASLDIYSETMDQLFGKLKAAGLPVTVMTPSPYDQGMVSPPAAPTLPGCNDGLGRAAGLVEKLAQSHACDLVDFYQPMTDLLEEIQAKNPAGTLVGPDRIHPRSKGSWVMAWLFLKAQDVSGLVSTLNVDCRRGIVTDVSNCVAEVTDCSSGDVTVRVQPKVLPLPAAGSYAQADELISLSADLNREIIQIQNLEPGNYALTLNDQDAGRYTAEALSGGINISVLENNPNQQKALHLFEMLYEYIKLQRSFQDITFLNIKVLKPRGLNPDDIEKGLDYFRNQYDVVTLGDRIRVASYLEWRGKEDQLDTRLNALLDEIYARSSPDPVLIRISRVK